MNLTSLSDNDKTDLFRYGLYFIEGLLLSSFNFLIGCSIWRHTALYMMKEYVIISGLAFVDGINGLASLTCAIYRIPLILYGEHIRLGVILSVISCDRLLAVLAPLKYLMLSRKYAFVLIGGAFTFGLLAMVTVGASAIGHTNQTVKAICLAGWAMDPRVYSAIYSIQMSGTLFSIGLYGGVFVIHKRMKRKIQNSERVHQQHQLRKQRRLTKSLAISCVFTFIFFGLPNSVILFANMFDSKNLEFFVPWAYIIANINPILNLFIYWKRQKDLRMGIIAFGKCKTMPPVISLWNVSQVQ